MTEKQMDAFLATLRKAMLVQHRHIKITTEIGVAELPDDYRGLINYEADGSMTVFIELGAIGGRPLLYRQQGPRSGLNATVGRWPGDESEEVLRAALRELS